MWHDLPPLAGNAGKAASRGSMETGCQGHTLGTRDPPCGGPLRNPGTFSHSPACPVSGHSPFLLESRPRARDRRRHFSLFPGCARTAHNPNKPRSFASQRIPPLDAEAPRACALRLSAPPLRRAAPPLSSPVRAQAQSLAVDALANGVRARLAEREGVGPARLAAPRYVGMRLAVGSRGNHGSLPGTSHSAFLAYRKNCTKTGVTGLFILLNCWGQGEEEAASTRRRQTHAPRLNA